MKFVKFGIFALALGMFVASCGETANEETEAVDTTTMETPMVEEPVMVDTMAAPMADTTMNTEATETTETPAQ